MEADRGLHGFGFKIGVVVLKEIVFFVYGVVYLLGIANLISSFSEQVFYTYGDVMLKVVQASVLVVVRNWEDLALLQRALEQKVEAGKEDCAGIASGLGVHFLLRCACARMCANRCRFQCTRGKVG